MATLLEGCIEALLAVVDEGDRLALAQEAVGVHARVRVVPHDLDPGRDLCAVLVEVQEGGGSTAGGGGALGGGGAHLVVGRRQVDEDAQTIALAPARKLLLRQEQAAEATRAYVSKLKIHS